MAGTWTWIGTTSDPSLPGNWTLTSGTGNVNNRPTKGDTVIFSGGTTVPPSFLDNNLNSITADLTGNGSIQFNNDTTLATQASMDSLSTINATGTATSLGINGPFTNNGTIEVTGTNASLSIAIGAGSAAPGTLVNNGTILVGQGDKLTISGGSFSDVGGVFVDGGTAVIAGTLTGLDNYSIGTGGTLELNQSGSQAIANVSFTGTAGLLKLDQPGAFAGSINNFANGDTLDLGNTPITSIVFDGLGDIIALNNTTTVFVANDGPIDGPLGGNGNSGTFALGGTGGVAGLLQVTEGAGDTQITVVGPSTWTWKNGASAPGNTAADWTLTSGAGNGFGIPQNGDTAINTGGTIQFGTNPGLGGTTIEVGGTAGIAAVSGIGTSNTTLQHPTLGGNGLITSAVPGNTTPETTLVDAEGIWINQGTIDANGPAGSNFTLAISGTTIAGTFQPGYFINYSQINVEAGNTMTISVAANSELFNSSVIQVNGGTLVINAAVGAIAGGFAPVAGAIVIDGGGKVETNSAFVSGVAGTLPVYAFADSTAGNTLKIDNLGSFGGLIFGFGQNDTIDLGTSLSVGQVVYSSTTGVLNLENAGGTILDSLLLASGNFATGTFAVVAGVADGIAIGSSGGDTVLTTAVQNDTYNSSNGTWQTGANWSSFSPPGSLDTALIGIGASGAFTLTTGASPVTVGALALTDDHALLQITSNTTAGPYVTRIFAGTIEVTSGNTLTATQLSMTSGTMEIDAAGVLDITGRGVTSLAPTAGTLAVVNGNTAGIQLSAGTLLINGGILNAGTGQAGGNGGRILIGRDGGGTPAVMTVQSSGTNAATVTDLYTAIGSDPVSFGVLTLNGNVSWTDQIDPHDASTTRGFMLVGSDQQVANFGTNLALPFSGAATLVVANGASLTEQSYAEIAASVDSAGTVLVSGATWNIGSSATGGFLSIGQAGSGALSVMNSGTVAIGNSGTFLNNGATSTSGGINLGVSAGATGSLTVSGAGALVTDKAGITVGAAGSGNLQILNGGTVQLTNVGGMTLGGATNGSGTILISGTDPGSSASSVLSFSGTNKGMSVGGASGASGTLDIESGGTFLMNGTAGIGVGASLGSHGLVIINGPSALLSEGTLSTGMAIGQNGSGTLFVENGGSLVTNGTGASAGISVGAGAGVQGLLVVTGTNSNVSMNGPNSGFSVGSAGQGTLEVMSGGSVSVNGKSLSIGTSATGSGTVLVSGLGASLSTLGTATINVGTPGTGVLTIDAGGSVSSAAGIFIATGGTTTSSGTITVNAGGTLSDTGPLTVGSNGSGTLSVQGGVVQSSGGGITVAGNFASASGLLIINGGTVSDPGSFTVGNANATGSLLVEGGGTLLTNGTFFPVINASGTGHATAVVSGGTWDTTSGLIIATTGTGSLDINSHGLVLSTGTNGITIGNTTGAVGIVTVENNGTLSSTGLSVGTPIGGTASGTLIVSDAGTATLGGLFVQGGGTAIVGGTTLSALLTDSGIFLVGQSGANAVLTVGQLGTISVTGTQSGDIGFNSGSSGTVAVSGGTILGLVGLQIGGLNDTGLLSVTAGGLVVTNGGTTQGIGVGQGFGPGGTGSGTIIINGGTLLETGSSFGIGGSNTTGSLLVTGGGLLSTALGGGFGNAGDFNATGTGHALGTVSGGTWNLNGQLIVGDNGTGSLDINSSGLVNAGTSAIILGNQTGGAGAVSVETGGTLAGGDLTVGSAFNTGATGTLTVGAVSTVSVSGVTEGAGGAITVSGVLAVNGNTGGVSVGSQGTGVTLTINTGGVVNETGTLNVFGTSVGTVFTPGTFDTVSIGSGFGTTASSGIIAVNGGTLLAADGIAVGGGSSGSSGTLAVTNGTVITAGLTVASNPTTTGTVTLSGGLVNDTGVLLVGSQGSGIVTVNAGSLAAIGLQFGQPGGPGSGTLQINGGNVSDVGSLVVGNGGTAIMVVGTGAAFAQHSTNTSFAPLSIGSSLGGTGEVIVDAGQFTTNGSFDLAIGNGGNGSLLVENGGTVVTGYSVASTVVDINANGTAQASATVTGVGSEWNVTAANAQFIVGDNGTGSLTIGTGGTVNVGGTTGSTDTVIVGNMTGASGTVVVGNAPVLFDGTGVTTAAEFFGGTLNIGTTAGASGTVTVNGSAGIQFGSLSIGSGGTLVLAGGLANLLGAGTNAGIIVGQGDFSGGITNTGTVLASGGLLDFGPIDGNGLIEIAGGATLDLSATDANSGVVTFGTSALSETLAINLVNSGSFGINNWQVGDKLQLGNVLSAQWMGGGTLDVSTGTGGIVFTNVNLAGGALPIFTTGTNFVELVACFAAGTHIRTTRGEAAVEDLVEGDIVPTGIDGSEQPVVWIGHRTVDCTRHPQPRTVWPVRVSAGAFGPGLPARDLVLSPDHAVYVNEVLVPVKHLINGSTIVQTPVDRVTYYHVELERHDVVFAEGLPAESYLEVGDRANFANGGPVVRMQIDLAHRWEAEGCAPLVIAGPELAAARACVAAAAQRAA